ncbi:hypothetical protein Fmac_027017 [Flemingia macrophylla]|uniref:Uncharacterized protein n=1 Tax=Flemingia macrophylla TaxID=520843 RepID=A0ABD1LH08_9FABA
MSTPFGHASAEPPTPTSGLGSPGSRPSPTLPSPTVKLDTSQTIFIGLMKLPVDLPNIAFRNARLAVDCLSGTLAMCAVLNKARMKRGEEPSCLISFRPSLSLFRDLTRIETHSSSANARPMSLDLPMMKGGNENGNEKGGS